MTKEKIRPIYTELQGMLSAAPSGDGVFDEERIWEDFNNLVNELNKLDDSYDYTRFRISPNDIKQSYGGGSIVDVITYRTKNNGLIMHLYGKFFPETTPPFSGQPMVAVTQNQSQSQTQVQTQMVLELQSFIAKKLGSTNLKGNERSFLEKIKAGLSTIKDYAGYGRLIMEAAKAVGLDTDTASKLVG